MKDKINQLFSPSIRPRTAFFTLQLHPALPSLERSVSLGLQPSADFKKERRKLNYFLRPLSRAQLKLSLTRWRQAAIRSQRPRSASSLRRLSPALSGPLWSMNGSGFSKRKCSRLMTRKEQEIRRGWYLRLHL